MGYKEAFLFALFLSAVTAQSYKVCVSQAITAATCQSISRDDSQAQCLRVESRVDCALMLANSQADVGYFSEEETLLLGQQQPNDNRVIATVRDVDKLDPYAFETVAVVPNSHTNGLEGLRGGVYCHPGLGQSDVRWSPRVLKTLEELAARTDRCSEIDVAQKTADELEVHTLSQFFSAACRPGTWSSNSSVDANLKSRYPNLCSLCGTNSDCSRYTIDMGVSVAGVRNENTHIQALECLRTNNNNSSRSAVTYVAWQHVREYFTIRNPQDVANYGVLCTNGTVVPLTNENLANTTSPCALVKQPWGTIVANANAATNLLTGLRNWWPTGSDPGGNTWQSALFTALAGGSNRRVVFQDTPIFPLNYTQSIRPINSIDSTASCLPSRRWCVLSNNELTKCNWVRTASYILGLQPTITCLLRSNVFDCLTDIKDDKADFISAESNYGYVARQHFKLTPVKLVQNAQADAYRVAAFVKESAVASSNITRFENLRDRKACFPEFGGLAYMAFVRTGHERQILDRSECDYARVVGEFFNGSCAPGAMDASHTIYEGSDFNASTLCSSCRSAVAPLNSNSSNLTCAWDYTNIYFGNNGSLACLADENNDVAFLNIRGISTYLTALGLQQNQFRALCSNNSLALNPGVTVDDGCLLAFVVDAEVLTRRNDPLYNSLNVLFDSIDEFFGYSAANGNQLINLEIFSPFGGNSNLLFKDSTIGITEPTTASTHEPARNYIQLFQHLDGCTSAAMGLAHRNVHSILAIILMAIMTRFVIA